MKKTPTPTPTPTIVLEQADDGRPYWILRARNGEIVCTSETYESVQAAKKTISKLAKIVSKAKFVDNRPHGISDQVSAAVTS